MLLSMLPNEAEVVEDAARLGFAWQGLAEIEPRQISTLTDICGRLTELLYVWLASGSDIDWKPTNSIAEACISIGQIVWPVLHPPNRDWPSPSKMLPGTFPHLISVISKTIWNCPDEGHLFLVTCSTSSAEPSLRGCALGALSRHFRDDPQTKALVRARAVEDTDGRPRGAALQALAEHFRDDPQIKALLRARAVEDKDGDPRGAALQALAEHFRDDPQTKALLRARAVEDKDGDPRRAALQALSRHFRDDPQTRALLRARAVEDTDGRLRRAALQALAEHFRDDPQIKALLRARAVEDKDGDPRGAALQALAEHFRDDPQTKALLRARAVEDPDGRCRGAALFGFAQTLAVRELAVLASQYLDGLTPGRDPRKPVTFDDIARAVVSLSKSEEEIRALYQRLSAEVPLTFADND